MNEFVLYFAKRGLYRLLLFRKASGIHSTHRTTLVARILLFKASPKTRSDGRKRSMLDKCKTGFRERIRECIPWSTNEHQPSISYPAGKISRKSSSCTIQPSRGTTFIKSRVAPKRFRSLIPATSRSWGGALTFPATHEPWNCYSKGGNCAGNGTNGGSQHTANSHLWPFRNDGL